MADTCRQVPTSGAHTVQKLASRRQGWDVVDAQDPLLRVQATSSPSGLQALGQYDADAENKTSTRLLTCTLGDIATVIMPYMVKNVSVMKVKAQ